MNAYITKLSVKLPNAPVDNDTMEAVLGVVGGRPSRAKRLVLRSNGIKARHYVIDPATGVATHTNAQLAAEAIRGLEGDGFKLESIDLLACGTTLADQFLPNPAVMVHGELGNPPCETMASAGICLAGVTALKYAALGVAAGEFKVAVACASETPSLLLRSKYYEAEIEARVAELETKPEIAFEKDFLRWMLSDGAAAALVQAQPAPKGLSLRIDWIFERSYANEMDTCMYGGAEKQPDGTLKPWHAFSPQDFVDRAIMTIKQDVKQLNEHVMEYTITRGLKDLQAAKGIQASDVDWFLPHYSSHYFRERVFEAAKAAGFEVPYDKWFTNLYEKGNTGSASIFIIMEELLRSGRLKEGQRLLCYIPESGRFSTGFISLTVCGPQA